MTELPMLTPCTVCGEVHAHRCDPPAESLPTRNSGLVGCRVHAADPDVQGTVVADNGGDFVRVQWDDGEFGPARRDLLYLVPECGPREPEAAHPDDPIVHGNRWRRERDEARAEVERLKTALSESSENNTRNRTEARRLRQEVERLRETGDEMAAFMATWATDHLLAAARWHMEKGARYALPRPETPSPGVKQT